MSARGTFHYAKCNLGWRVTWHTLCHVAYAKRGCCHTPHSDWRCSVPEGDSEWLLYMYERGTVRRTSLKIRDVLCSSWSSTDILWNIFFFTVFIVKQQAFVNLSWTCLENYGVFVTSLPNYFNCKDRLCRFKRIIKRHYYVDYACTAIHDGLIYCRWGYSPLRIAAMSLNAPILVMSKTTTLSEVFETILSAATSTVCFLFLSMMYPIHHK